MTTPRPHPLVIPLDELDPTPHSHEFVGAEHGDVPFSVILVHSQPGVGPKVHRHPYAEVFIVESGEATFRLGDDAAVVSAGHVVVGPPDVPHGFTNTGTVEPRPGGHPRRPAVRHRMARRRRPDVAIEGSRVTSYLVLLRGINVGGRNKVPMAELRSVFEDLGFSKVSTYIASGNVLLDSDLSAAKVASTIEEALPKAFKLHAELIRVAVLPRARIEAVVKHRPRGFGDEPAKYHSDAIFLMGIDANDALAVFSPRAGVDTVWPGDGVIYHHRLSARRVQSRLNRIVGTPAYASMTVRSWQTTVALFELMRNRDR